MGRRRSTDRAAAEVDTGVAELVPDPDRAGSWTLLLDGAPQSHVDLTDPTHLEFEYVRRLGAAIDLLAPAGAPLRLLHLGGGALTLPRYVAATRPGSTQRVCEVDGALVELVRQKLPWPPNPRLRVRVADAREALTGLRDASLDIVVADVFAGARTPAHLTSVEFAAEVARVLRPPAGTWRTSPTARRCGTPADRSPPSGRCCHRRRWLATPRCCGAAASATSCCSPAVPPRRCPS